MGEEMVFDRIDADLFIGADMSAAIIKSTPQKMFEMTGWYSRCVFTGSPVGTFKAQASANATGNPPSTDGEWSDIADSSQAISAAGEINWNYSDANYNWLRIVYTKTSGTGSLSGRLNAKGN